MKNNAIERAVQEIRQPLAGAAVCLSAHSSRIRKLWARLLDKCAPCGQYASLLSGLHLAARIRDVSFTDTRTYRLESEQQGQDLASRGLPTECVVASIALYVESCVPSLRSDDRKGAEWIRALTRWASFYQFCLLTGYSRHEAAERLLLEEKIGQAERRVRDFSVELADTYEKERRRLAQDLHD